MPSKKKKKNKAKANGQNAAVITPNENETTSEATPDMNEAPYTISQVFEELLNNQNSSKATRDIALSHLNDSIGMGTRFSGKAEIRYNEEQYEWTIVEDYEEGNWDRDNTTAIISIAADIILEKEGDDSKEIMLSARGMRIDGTFDDDAGYPKLCTACKNIIDSSNADKEIKSNSYAVLGFLEGYSSLEKSRFSVEKAVKLNPTDWRLHAMLATRHMSVWNTLQSLECISRAMELTDDIYAKFTLGMRQGKILFNLNRHDETIATFTDIIRMYDSALKDHPKMTDKALGRLAVAEYMLVSTYGFQGKTAKAANHYRDAEKKRNSIDKTEAEKINWTCRMLATAAVSKLHPGFISHGECHHCGKVTDNPKRCSICKVVFYCGKECQKLAWKNGHKKECKTLKSERDTERAEDRKEYKNEQKRSKMPPLDVNLDPKGLWKEGIKLSKLGKCEDAAWKFLVALFMSAALDANDKAPVKVAVDGCKKDDAVAKALSSILCHEEGLKPYAKVCEWAAERNGIKGVEMSPSVDDVDRNSFGLGMCKIMYARKLGIIFACKSAADARCTENKMAFDEVAKLVQQASFYIDPQRWLTMQFEMGYSSMDVGAVNEAEKWLNLFTNTLDRTKSLQTNRGAAQHWSGMKSSASSRLIQLPLLKSLRMNNPGLLQEGETGGDECVLM